MCWEGCWHIVCEIYFAWSPFLLFHNRKLKEYLVPGYKLNNLLSNYAFERHKLGMAALAGGTKCRKKRMKLWQTLEAAHRSSPESMQHFRAFLWLTKEAAEREGGQGSGRGQAEMRWKLDTMLQASYWTTEGLVRGRAQMHPQMHLTCVKNAFKAKATREASSTRY